jgi:hypothetical protein
MLATWFDLHSGATIILTACTAFILQPGIAFLRRALA